MKHRALELLVVLAATAAATGCSKTVAITASDAGFRPADGGCEVPCGDGCCGPNEQCDEANGACVAACVPDCGERRCGDDGCGGSCGSCVPGAECSGAGVCEAQPAPATYSGFCELEADMRAYRHAACEGGPFASWRSVLRENARCTVLGRAVERGDAVYDPGAVRGCIEWYQNASCLDLAVSPDDPCERVLEGRLTGGATCYLDIECEPAGWCTATDVSCPGVCQPYVAEGGACGSSMEWCANGLACAGGTCRRRARSGEACGGPDGIPCQVRHVCAGELASSPGKCEPLQPGATCDPSMWPSCPQRYHCEREKATDPTGICREDKAEGQPCTVGHNECGAFLSCIDGICRRDGGPGSACGTIAGEPVDCVGAWCDDLGGEGHCLSYRGVGAPCDQFTVIACGGGSCDTVRGVCVEACSRP